MTHSQLSCTSRKTSDPWTQSVHMTTLMYISILAYFIHFQIPLVNEVNMIWCSATSPDRKHICQFHLHWLKHKDSRPPDLKFSSKHKQFFSQVQRAACFRLVCSRYVTLMRGRKLPVSAATQCHNVWISGNKRTSGMMHFSHSLSVSLRASRLHRAGQRRPEFRAARSVRQWLCRRKAPLRHCRKITMCLRRFRGGTVTDRTQTASCSGIQIHTACLFTACAARAKVCSSYCFIIAGILMILPSKFNSSWDTLTDPEEQHEQTLTSSIDEHTL